MEEAEDVGALDDLFVADEEEEAEVFEADAEDDLFSGLLDN